MASVIAAGRAGRSRKKRPVNVQELHEHLVAEYGYARTYLSVLRYVRARYRQPTRRTCRRMEMPPGAQEQTDWGEYPRVDLATRPEPLSAVARTSSLGCATTTQPPSAAARRPGRQWNGYQCPCQTDEGARG
jgi:hypothetical protein